MRMSRVATLMAVTGTVLAGTVLMSSEAQAAPVGVETGDKVKVLSQVIPNTTSAGPFLIDDLTDGSVSNFLTFCVERDEFLNVGGEYFVKVSDKAEAGGVNTNSGDFLDNRTGYLYSNFMNGTLSGYLGDQASYEGLQLAIWRIEEEVNATYNGLAPLSQVKANYFYDLATNAAPASTFGVKVMQLWNAYNPSTGVFSGYKQDQLVYVPEPVSTFSALLFSTAVLGMVRRRIRA
jgi:hypothetical protein